VGVVVHSTFYANGTVRLEVLEMAGVSLPIPETVILPHCLTRYDNGDF